MSALIVPFLVNWLFLFVACFIVTEAGHNYFYDERPPRAGLRVALASCILAGLQTWLRTSFDTMFTSEIQWTVLQGIVWFLVFMFVLLFHPPHALALGLATMLLIPAMSDMAVDSLTTRSHRAQPDIRRPNKPYRATTTTAPETVLDPEQAKAKDEPKP